MTCDRLFAQRRLSDYTFFVSGCDKKAQLTEVLAAFDLTVQPADLLSRCAKCNGTFIPRYWPFLAVFMPGGLFQILAL